MSGSQQQRHLVQSGDSEVPAGTVVWALSRAGEPLAALSADNFAVPRALVAGIRSKGAQGSAAAYALVPAGRAMALAAAVLDEGIAAAAAAAPAAAGGLGAQLVDALSPLDLSIKLVASGLQPALGYMMTQTEGGAGVALLASDGVAALRRRVEAGAASGAATLRALVAHTDEGGNLAWVAGGDGAARSAAAGIAAVEALAAAPPPELLALAAATHRALLSSPAARAAACNADGSETARDGTPAASIYLRWGYDMLANLLDGIVPTHARLLGHAVTVHFYATEVALACLTSDAAVRELLTQNNALTCARQPCFGAGPAGAGAFPRDDVAAAAARCAAARGALLALVDARAAAVPHAATTVAAALAGVAAPLLAGANEPRFVVKQLRDLAGLCARAAGLLFSRLGRVATLGDAAIEATKAARGWPAENARGALLPFDPLLALPPRWLRVWLPVDVGSRDSVELDGDAGVDCNVDKRPVQLTKVERWKNERRALVVRQGELLRFNVAPADFRPNRLPMDHLVGRLTVLSLTHDWRNFGTAREFTVTGLASVSDSGKPQDPPVPKTATYRREQADDAQQFANLVCALHIAALQNAPPDGALVLPESLVDHIQHPCVQLLEDTPAGHLLTRLAEGGTQALIERRAAAARPAGLRVGA